ncbi:MAG: glycosyltransferase family 2 protein [Sodaliphilus sp.]
MLFSIIIPVYNRAEKVKATLASVLAQTHRPLQVVLVDNRSTDGSLQVLRDFQQAHSTDDFQVVVAQEEFQSASAARNRGLMEAKGEWVVFYDSDDTMNPRLVEAYHSVVQKHLGNLDMVVLKVRLHSMDGSSRILPFFTSDLFANHILHSILATVRYAARKDFFMAHGVWNKHILQWDDWELGVRLLLSYPRLDFIREPFVDIYESGVESISGVNFFDSIGRWERALDEAERQVAASTHPEKSRLTALIHFRRLVLAAHYEKEGHPAEAQALYLPAYHAIVDARPRLKMPMQWLYRYTRNGYRGASRIARHLLSARGIKNQPKPLFSIIIPVFNRSKQVKVALQSVLAQTYRPLQVVLVDNGSVDNTLSVLRDFQQEHSSGDFQVVVTQEQKSTASAARNTGLRASQGDWLVFFDSDDVMKPTLVEQYHRTIMQHPEGVDAVLVKVRRHSHGKSRTLPYFTSDVFANHILHSILATQRYAIKREYFETHGWWNEDFYEWVDWDLGIRLMLGNPRLAFVNQTLVDIYDSGEASITGVNFYSRKGKWERVLNEAEHYLRQSNHPDKERLLSLVDFRRLVLAAHYEMEGHPQEARQIYDAVAPKLIGNHPVRRIAIPLLYQHISKGHRGASRIARYLLK